MDSRFVVIKVVVRKPRGVQKKQIDLASKSFWRVQRSLFSKRFSGRRRQKSSSKTSLHNHRSARGNIKRTYLVVSNSMVAITFASPMLQEIRLFSFGTCALGMSLLQQATGSPSSRRCAATVPPPTPFGCGVTL